MKIYWKSLTICKMGMTEPFETICTMKRTWPIEMSCRLRMMIAISPRRNCSAKDVCTAMWCHRRRCLYRSIERMTNICWMNAWLNSRMNMNFERDTFLQLILLR
jgi:hypothetical protein